MTRVKRKAASARTTALRGKQRRRVGRAKARGGSLLDAALSWVPLSEAGLHRLFVGGIFAGVAGCVCLVAVLAGVPALAMGEVVRLARSGGFEVRRIEVRGTKHLNELRIYERVLAERDRAMPEVDLTGLRNDLMQLSWVADARVSRQLPDRLVIDVIERTPRAVVRLSDEGEPASYALVDETGHILEAVPAARAHDYPLIAGAGVTGQVGALGALMAAAPALRHQVAEADWVGNRRWNLVFRTGQILSLPEGPDAAAGALVTFARLDGTNRLLGGRVADFDMRAGDRIYFRVPNRAQISAGPGADNQRETP